ncbi:MAG TPA: hypothetical protein VEX38_03000, partial [Fimbriimonadaceae bacterium]|nr:hypothetical protein [Fimbriimonadaceae bacterium]
MSGFSRALYGAVIGGLATLLLHPLSRPFLTTTFLRLGVSREMAASSWLVENNSKLSTPANLLQSSMWMEAGAKKIRTRGGITAPELQGLIDTAHQAAEEDPDNGYWRQMEAVFLAAKKDKKGAWAAWRKAANCARWDDLQSRRLVLIAQEMARSQGASLAWHYAALYPKRSSAAADAIQSLSREIVRSSKLHEPEGLRMRHATVMNGKLLREGGRKLEVAQLGINT